MANRYDGSVRTPTGLAVPGADVAVLTQPADFSSKPGSPLAAIFSAATSNSATITAAVWNGGQIEFTFSTTPPADVLPGSYISVSGVTPSAYNSTLTAPWLVLSVVGNVVSVVSLANPGTYISGGTVATSVLPNPTFTDGNGNFFWYAAPGSYSVQIYGDTITERDLPDQDVGTVSAGGTVTSIALTAPAQFAVTGSPITSAGTLAIAWNNQTANTVLAGPTSGGAAVPTFRNLVAADFPAGVGTVSSVAHTLAVPASIMNSSVTGSPITTAGTLADTISLANQAANAVWAGPTSGGSGLPTFRALVVADVPSAGYTSLSSTLFVGNLQLAPTTLSGATDAITFPSDDWVTTAGVNAMTLATPTATTDDGKVITVTDTTGHAQTITTASNKIAPSHSLATFNGTVGSFLTLVAFQGLWYVRASSGVMIS